MRYLVVVLSLLLLPMSSMAVVGGLGGMPRPEPPQALSERGMAIAEMEEMIGGKMTPLEKAQLNQAFEQYEQIQSQPQNVTWRFGSVQFAPLACFQFRFDFGNLIPSANLKELIRKYISVSGEFQPCMDLSNLNGFMLTGASVVTNGGPGFVQAGIQVGVYLGPAHLNKPIIGEYYFVRGAIPYRKALRAQITFAADKDRCIMSELTRGRLGDCQVFAVGGVGMDLFDFIKELRSGTAISSLKSPANKVEPMKPTSNWGDWVVEALKFLNRAGFELSVGKLVSVEEIPREKIYQMFKEYKRMIADRARSIANTPCVPSLRSESCTAGR